MDTNWILECVMEAEGRDIEVAKKVKRLYDFIDDGEFEEARELMAKLREEVGNFGDVEAAESYIWRVSTKPTRRPNEIIRKSREPKTLRDWKKKIVVLPMKQTTTR